MVVAATSSGAVIDQRRSEEEGGRIEWAKVLGMDPVRPAVADVGGVEV